MPSELTNCEVQMSMARISMRSSSSCPGSTRPPAAMTRPHAASSPDSSNSGSPPRFSPRAAGNPGELDVGDDAGANDHEVALQTPAIPCHDGLDAICPRKTRDLVAEHKLHALLFVNSGHHRGDLIAEHARERSLSTADGDDFHADRGERGGDLGADEAQADDHGTLARSGYRFDGIALTHRAQLVYAVEVGAGQRQATIPAAGSEQKAIVVESATT